MNSYIAVTFVSSSREKWEQLCRRLSRCENLSISFVELASPPPEDIGAEHNARGKAIFASKSRDGLILASDEDLRFDGLADRLQPGAQVRRVAGDTASDDAVVDWYESLLLRMPDRQAKGTLTTYFAVARRGSIILEFAIAELMELRLPRATHWLHRRPLSAFHFVPRFNRKFAELSIEQQAVVDAAYGDTLAQHFRLLARCESLGD